MVFDPASAAAARPSEPIAVPRTIVSRAPNRSTSEPTPTSTTPEPRMPALSTAPSSNRLKPNSSWSSGPIAGSPKLTSETAACAADAPARTVPGLRARRPVTRPIILGAWIGRRSHAPGGAPRPKRRWPSSASARRRSATRSPPWSSRRRARAWTPPPSPSSHPTTSSSSARPSASSPMTSRRTRTTCSGTSRTSPSTTMGRRAAGGRGRTARRRDRGVAARPGGARAVHRRPRPARGPRGALSRA